MRTARLVVFFCLTWCPLPAQIEGLATNSDGSVLYFHSGDRLKDSDDTFDYKIFRWDRSGFSVLARPYGEFQKVLEPDVSDDGSRFSYSANLFQASTNPNCRFSPSLPDCFPVNRYEANVVVGGGDPQRFAGRIRLSADGRFAALLPGSDSAFSLLDLTTGERTVIVDWQPLPYSRRVVNGLGEVLIRQQERLGVWRDGKAHVLANVTGVDDATTDDRGRFVAYRHLALRHSEVRLLNRSTGETHGWDNSASPQLSSDGGTLVFLRVSQLVRISTANPILDPITSNPEGILSFALSGDGRVVFATTFGHRLLRIDLNSSQTEELSGPLPILRDRVPVLSPGSSVNVSVRGLSQERLIAPDPLPETFQGIRVFLNKQPARIYVVGPEELVFQIPWEFPEGQVNVSVESAASAFESAPFMAPVSSQSGLLIAAPPIHAAWQAFVSSNEPAVPGEVLHLYMTGLGAVSPAVPTGVSAAANPLSVSVTSLECFVGLQDGVPAKVLFSGLAPGLVGYCQAEVEIPSGVQLPRQTNLVCRTPGGQAATTVYLQ